MSELGKTVLVDMDGVMADFDNAALVSISKKDIVLRSSFYVAHDYPANLQPAIEDVYNAPEFFENLEPMPGLKEAWQEMIDNGYDPRVASAPLASNRSAVEGKIKWLDRVMVPDFGPKIVEEAIIDKQKWKYRGIALIDDRPDVPRGENGAEDAVWQHILFGWAHMSKVPLAATAFRLLSWRDINGLLSTLESIEKG
ncbi:MAG: 5(3)-deoxyribonucleotidase [Candidatus Saccharibacteria bacterium]|nr:5(3)-deoxyribonucleotidase [Candidatus Saccharibacteria bacterium]